MHIYEKNDLKMTSIHVVYNAGALYESKGREGTMHLMEHMVCKNFDDLRDMMQERGITYNAMTGDQNVTFFFKGLESKLSPVKEMLVKRLISGFNATEEQLISEKKVVVEEYLDVFNDQILGNYYNSMRNYYGFHGSIGLRSSIEKFNYADALEVYDAYFKKPVRIVEVGPTKSDFSFVEYSEDSLGDLGEFGYRETELESVNVNNKLSVIGISKIKCDKKDYPALSLGLSMLGDGLNSPLYIEIREKRGLSYFSWCDSMTYGSHATVLLGSCTEKDRANELCEVYNNVLSNIESYLTVERFDVCKKRAMVIVEKREVLRFENPEDLIVGNGLYQYEGLESLTFEYVIEVVKKYINNNAIHLVVA